MSLITPAVQKALEQAFAGFQKGLDAVINTALKQFQNGDWLLTVARVGGRNVKAAGLAQQRLETVYGSSFNQWGAEIKAALGESSGVICGSHKGERWCGYSTARIRSAAG